MQCKRDGSLAWSSKSGIIIQRWSLALTFPRDEASHYAVIINGYSAGDSIMPHSDDEKQIMAEFPITIYSFGDSASFSIYHKHNRTQLSHVVTEAGYSISMCGADFQKHYLHAVGRHEGSFRLSLTFRVCFGAQPFEDTYNFRHMSLPTFHCNGAEVTDPCAADEH